MALSKTEILKNNRERKKWYTEHKICPRCGKNDLYGEEKRCPECKAREAELKIKSIEKLGREKYNIQHAEYSRELHKRRIEQGLCTRCGKRKADKGFKTCLLCRGKINNYRRGKGEYKTPRSERYKQGKCYFCNNAIKQGYKVCEEHYLMNVQKAQSQNAVEAQKELIEKRIFW